MLQNGKDKLGNTHFLLFNAYYLAYQANKRTKGDLLDRKRLKSLRTSELISDAEAIELLDLKRLKKCLDS